jgi:hypothetical protein
MFAMYTVYGIRYTVISSNCLPALVTAHIIYFSMQCIARTTHHFIVCLSCPWSMALSPLTYIVIVTHKRVLN